MKKNQHIAVVTWGTAVLLLLLLSYNRQQILSAPGVAVHEQAVISAKQTAYIHSIIVRPFDTVRAGDTLGVRQSAMTESMTDQISGTLHAARNSIVVASFDLNSNQLEFYNKLHPTIQASAALAENINRSFLALSDEAQTAAHQHNLTTLRENYQAISTAIDNRGREEFANSDFGDALSNYLELLEGITENSLVPSSFSTSIPFHSPMDGQITDVNVKEGQTLLPGESILTVTSLKTAYIIAFIDDTLLSKISIGQSARISSARTEIPADGQIVEIGNAMDKLPDALLDMPGQIDMRVPVKIMISGDASFIHDETLDVQFIR